LRNGLYRFAVTVAMGMQTLKRIFICEKVNCRLSGCDVRAGRPLPLKTDVRCWRRRVLHQVSNQTSQCCCCCCSYVHFDQALGICGSQHCDIRAGWPPPLSKAGAAALSSSPFCICSSFFRSSSSSSSPHPPLYHYSYCTSGPRVGPKVSVIFATGLVIN
jgi:hypothetical protein